MASRVTAIQNSVHGGVAPDISGKVRTTEEQGGWVYVERKNQLLQKKFCFLNVFSLPTFPHLSPTVVSCWLILIRMVEVLTDPGLNFIFANYICVYSMYV